MILAGRRINNGMGEYVAEQTVKRMIAAGSPVKGATVNLLERGVQGGCADLRNSNVLDIVGLQPAADDMARTATRRCVSCHGDPSGIQAFPMDELVEKITARGWVIDVKSLFDEAAIHEAGVAVWRH